VLAGIAWRACGTSYPVQTRRALETHLWIADHVCLRSLRSNPSSPHLLTEVRAELRVDAAPVDGRRLFERWRRVGEQSTGAVSPLLLSRAVCAGSRIRSRPPSTSASFRCAA
jgi:hypothetical protein